MLAVIFDFDGTILDSETPEFESHRRFFAEYGVDLSRNEWCAGIGVVQPHAHWHEWLCARTARPPGFDQFRQATLQYFEDQVRFEPMPGIAPLLGALVAAGVPRAIASTAPARWVLRAVERLDLAPTFGAIVTGDQVARPKPAPDVYLEAARRLGVRPGACVAIEDSGPGLLSARAAGMRTVAIPHPLTHNHDFDAADIRVASASDLSLELLADLVQRDRGAARY